MQISVKTTSELGRKLTVEVPAEQISKAYRQRIQQMSQKAKISGFRPGKIPEKVIEQRFGNDIRQEVIAETMRTSLFEALKTEDLHIAGQPHLEPSSFELGKAFSYQATFEVYPDVKLDHLSEIAVDKFTPEITDEDIDKKINELSQQNPQWETVERTAKQGDQVTVSFKGAIDGKPLEKGSADNMPIQIGSNRMIPGFEEGVIGVKAGDTKELTLTLPENYPADLSGKEALFSVSVSKVEQPQMLAIDDKLAEHLGVKEGGLAALKAQLNEAMVRDLKHYIYMHVRNQVIEQLLAKHQLILPTALVDQEIHHLEHHKDPQQAELSAEEIEKQARRQISLRLLFGEIIKQDKIRLDSDKVSQQINEIAASYQDPEQVIKWYQENKQQLQHIENQVLETQVIDKIIEHANVTEKTVNYYGMMELEHSSPLTA